MAMENLRGKLHLLSIFHANANIGIRLKWCLLSSHALMYLTDHGHESDMEIF